VGQKVYFFPNGKKKNRELLFIVASNWKKDTVLQIDRLIKQRKTELLKE
jgi:hypothetical protein